MKKTIIMIITILVLASMVSAVDLEWKINSSTGQGDKCDIGPIQIPGYFVGDFVILQSMAGITSISLCGSPSEAILESQPITLKGESLVIKMHIPTMAGGEVYIGVEGMDWQKLSDIAPASKECIIDEKKTGDQGEMSQYTVDSYIFDDQKPHRLSLNIKSSKQYCTQMVTILSAAQVEDISDSSGTESYVPLPTPPKVEEIDLGCPAHMKKVKGICVERCNSTSLDDYKMWDPIKQECVDPAEDISKLLELEDKIEEISKKLDFEGYYVRNPFEGKEFTGFFGNIANRLLINELLDGIFKAKSVVYDNSYDIIFNKVVTSISGDLGARKHAPKGITCQDYVDKTSADVKQSVIDVYGQGSNVKLEEILFEEGSSQTESGNTEDSLDSFNQDNHILFKLTVDGKEYFIDLWDRALGKRAIGEWGDVEEHWSKFLKFGGDSFCYSQSNLLIGTGRDISLHCE